MADGHGLMSMGGCEREANRWCGALVVLFVDVVFVVIVMMSGHDSWQIFFRGRKNGEAGVLVSEWILYVSRQFSVIEWLGEMSGRC